MSISYPLALPTSTRIASITFSGTHAQKITGSPITFKQQVLDYTAQRWQASVKIPPCRRALAQPWISFLFSLKGQKGTFLMGDMLGCSARGSASVTPGTPVVNGAGQTGATLNVSGLPTSIAGYLEEGDYIQLGAASSATLHKVLNRVTSDGIGTASIDIWPDIVAAPANGATVVVANPVGLWRLTSPVTDFSIDNAAIYGIEFDAMQVIT